MNMCGFDVGLDHPFFLIAGTCVIESEGMALDVAGELKEITGTLGIPFIYKSSFDKANRSSHASDGHVLAGEEIAAEHAEHAEKK